jgi:hypothetical protein
MKAAQLLQFRLHAISNPALLIGDNMKKYNKTLTIMAAFLIIFVCKSSYASMILTWNFDQTVYTVAPTDAILVTATLYNDPLSDGNLVFQGVGASFTGDMQKLYDFTFGPPDGNFAVQFFNLDLAPGESFPFVWGSLVPIGGFVPPGTYGPDPAFLTLHTTVIFPSNAFQVIVVPEPCSFILAFLACVGLLGAKFIRRASTNDMT